MAAEVVFGDAARGDVLDLYETLVPWGGRDAIAFLIRLELACEGLTEWPLKGRPRPDLGPGLRALAVERRAVVLYRPEEARVRILAVAYAGRDLRALAGRG